MKARGPATGGSVREVLTEGKSREPQKTRSRASRRMKAHGPATGGSVRGFAHRRGKSSEPQKARSRASQRMKARGPATGGSVREVLTEGA